MPVSSSSTPSNCWAKFVYQKISATAFIQDKHGNLPPASTAYFAIGSWDDHADNSLSVWAVDGWAAGNVAAEPRMVHKEKHVGDVNKIRFCGHSAFVTASSSGSVSLHCIEDASDGVAVRTRKTWDKLHCGSGGGFRYSCNGLSCLSGNAATAGEDGAVAVINVGSGDVVRRFSKADSCSIADASFVKHDEVLTANVRGQLKLFDLRSQSESPSRTSLLTAGDASAVGVTCLATHPTQAHIVASGASDGSIAFWDLRGDAHPVTILQGHEQAVNAVQFHAQQPHHMFSCSESGEVWHWDGGAVARSNFGNQGGDGAGTANPTQCLWFNSEAVKHRVETASLLSRQPLPLNALDSLGSSLLVGGDSEAVYLLADVF